MKLFGREVGLPSRKEHKRNASDSEGGGLSKFMVVFDNKRNRFIMTGFLGAILLMNLILAIIAIRGTNDLNAALGATIFLTIVTALDSGFLLWRPIPDAGSKKKAYMYLGNSAFLALLWAVQWIWLAAAVVAAGNKDDEQTNNDQNNNQNTNQNGNARLLFARQDPNTNNNTTPPAPRAPVENGCIVLGVFLMFFWIFNAVYVQIRTSKLYPKYAEVTDDNHAFDARMNEEHDEEHELQMRDNTVGTYNDRDDRDDRYDSHGQSHDQYGQETQPGAYDPLDNNDRVTPPARTGYTPQGYVDETEYRPPHHQASYGERMSPPPAYPPAGEPAYAPYQDEAYARTGQNQYQRKRGEFGPKGCTNIGF